MINNYLKIPIKLLYWERLKPGRKNYSLVTITIKNMRQYMNKKVTAQTIAYALQNSLPIVTIYGILQKMTKENIIYKDDELGFDLNNEFLKSIDKIELKSKTEYFVVYYSTIRYAIENKHSTYIAYILSRMMNFYDTKHWPTYMTEEYVHTMMEGIFTIAEERTMIKNLVNDKLLDRELYKVLKGSWVTYRILKYNEYEITKMVMKHENKLKNMMLDLQTIQTIARDQTKNTRDQVKSGSYTKEEIEMFRKKAEEEEAQGEKMWF